MPSFLSLETEYSELDYKATIDLESTRSFLSLVKHIGAMSARGGFILGGVDSRGKPTGQLDKADLGPFDEARLKPRLLRHLPNSVELHVNVVEVNAHQVVAICIQPNPVGCSFFTADGTYLDEQGDEQVVFRAGDAYYRDGTRSVRLSHEGFEEVIKRRIATEKENWMDEQREIRRREREELERAYEGQRLADGPLGGVSLDLDSPELSRAALDLVRGGDEVALRHLLIDAVVRARAAVDSGDIESGLTEILNKLTCLAATFLQYEQSELFEKIVKSLVEIYASAFGENDARRFGHSTSISAEEKGPRVWLAILERLFSLGALAVRLEAWQAIRTLTLQLPAPLEEDGYEANWLRHALTMASRAQQFERGDERHVSLLSLARTVISDLPCLRADGVGTNDDVLLSSLAQFDVLANLVAISDARSVDGKVFYPHFARVRQNRIQRMVDRVLTDNDLREIVFPLEDEDLAIALNEIGRRAADEGWRFDGFMGWENTAVRPFLEEHLPPPPEESA